MKTKTAVAIPVLSRVLSTNLKRKNMTVVNKTEITIGIIKTSGLYSGSFFEYKNKTL